MQVATSPLYSMYLSNISGAIFCHVSKIRQIFQLEFFMTWGNQKCKGGTPAFIINVKKITMLKTSMKLEKEITLLDTLEKTRINEAIACTRKYLIAVSVVAGVNLIIIRGIILIKLISRPNHDVNQFDALTAIMVPITKVELKIS